MNDKTLVQLIADGLTVPEIAEKHNLNVHALTKKLQRLKTRLGCKKSTELVAYYFKKGVLK